MKIMVYPVAAAALNIPHPLDGLMRPGGSMWESDGFTARMLVDGVISKTPPGKTFAAPAPRATGTAVTAPRPKT